MEAALKQTVTNKENVEKELEKVDEHYKVLLCVHK